MRRTTPEVARPEHGAGGDEACHRVFLIFYRCEGRGGNYLGIQG